MIDEHLVNAIKNTHQDAMKYGVVISANDIKPTMRRYAIELNWGKARKISIKRPSNQLSRNKLAQLRAMARLEVLVKKGGDND